MLKKIIRKGEKEIKIAAGAEVFLLDASGEESGEDVLKISVGSGARLEYVLISGTMPFSGRREIALSAGAVMSSYQVFFGEGDCRWQQASVLGEGVTYNQRVLFYGRGEQSLRIDDRQIFSGRSAQGRFRVDGLLDDSARAEYLSEIVIEPAAQKSDARIDMKLHILSDRARGTVLPGLKIAANEVKAGHGASTWHLGGEDLFYLESRGLSAAQIKSLVIASLANDFIRAISDTATQKIILNEIAKRQL